MVTVNRDALVYEAVLQSAQAVGLLDGDGALTDPVAQARVARRPGEVVTVRGVPLRDVLSLRGQTLDGMTANFLAERATSRPSGSTDPRSVHPDIEREEGAALDDFQPPEAWVLARSIPQEEITQAMALAEQHEITGGGDQVRDVLLLALMSRIDRLEERVKELENGGAK